MNELLKMLEERAPQGWFLASAVKLTANQLRLLEQHGYVESSKVGSRVVHYRVVPRCKLHGEKLPCEECGGDQHASKI